MNGATCPPLVCYWTHRKVLLAFGQSFNSWRRVTKGAGRPHNKDKQMKKLILLAGAAMLVITAPAVAKPEGHGHSKHSLKNHSQVYKGGKASHSKHAFKNYSQAHKGAKAHRGIIMSDNGRLYGFDRRGSCPPGLAKKNNGCLPPGQARKIYNVGQRYNRNFGNVWTYNQIPEYLRSQYRFDQSDRYYYRNGYVYQVDPKTMLVQQVISALLR
jgi:hypothetical protein